MIHSIPSLRFDAFLEQTAIRPSRSGSCVVRATPRRSRLVPRARRHLPNRRIHSHTDFLRHFQHTRRSPHLHPSVQSGALKRHRGLLAFPPRRSRYDIVVLGWVGLGAGHRETWRGGRGGEIGRVLWWSGSVVGDLAWRWRRLVMSIMAGVVWCVALGETRFLWILAEILGGVEGRGEHVVVAVDGRWCGERRRRLVLAAVGADGEARWLRRLFTAV